MSIGRIIAAVMLSATAAAASGCSGFPAGRQDAELFKSSRSIDVISREEGSGTRGSFIALFGIEQRDERGGRIDLTTDEAVITNSASVMLSAVAGNPYAIGYISICSLNGSVRPLPIDGVEPTAENLKNGSYKLSRPFIIAQSSRISEAADDFIGFIMSGEGKRVIEQSGYIAVNRRAFRSKTPSGRVTVAGSSSVAPLMERLGEAYCRKNPNAEVVIEQNDSATGISSAASGVCDLAISSRALEQSELEKGLLPMVIALDGLAVIVNPRNSVDGLTSMQVKAVYTGEATRWNQLD